MSEKYQNKFIIGLLTGILLTFAVGLIIKKSGPCPFSAKPGQILAEYDGGSLSRTDLDKTLASRLVPVENDEYEILSEGISEWLEAQLIEKEAKSKNIAAKDFYAQEIWNQVHVTPNDTLNDFRKNTALYNGQTYEQIAPLLAQKIRQTEYERVLSSTLDKLKEKYHVKIHLKKPDSYVPGLALPQAGTAPSVNAPATAPQAAAAAPPVRIVTFTDLKGRPSVGPETAPVTIVEFSDFHCPFCKNVGPTIDQIMKNYSGKVRRIWRHYPLPFHAGADRTAAASECAHEQGKFWQYHDKVFETLGGQRDDAALTQIAEQVGLDKNKFQSCLTSNKYKDLVQADIAKGTESGVSGTPAFFINGRLFTGAQPYQNFADEVDAAIDPSKRKNIPAPQAPAPPPPPTNVQFNDLAGRPSSGPDNAAITLVEFSDFHCPFCKRVEPTIDQLMKNYAGKIRKVWRHYPLPFHTGADRTHEASECAHEQGKFWPYHNLLIATVGETRDDAALLKFAEQAGVDKKKFEQCLTSGKYKDLIKKEIARGSEVGVNGTPAVFVNGQLVSGAQPYENFDAIIKAKLAEKK